MAKANWGKGISAAVCDMCSVKKSTHRVMLVGANVICLKCVRRIIRAYLSRYV